MLVERLAVFPNRNLAKAEYSEDRQDNYGKNTNKIFVYVMFSQQLRCQPYNRNTQSDVRNVCVSICMRLFSDLHDADNGHKCSGKPEPTCEEILSAASLSYSIYRNSSKQAKRRDNM